MRRLFLAATACFSALIAGSAEAEVALSGSFTAREACPATPSIHSSDNPGGVRLEVGRSYKAVAKNKDAATHYLLEAPGANPLRRWVAIGCGDFSKDAASGPSPAGGSQTFYVLAASWEPAFCATEPQKPECKIETPDGPDTKHLSLHGLWPDPDEYCNVPSDVVTTDKRKHFSELPPVDLSTPVRDALKQVMPGTMSSLERHEWVKHGACSGLTPDAYFAAATGLMAQLNASKVGALFASSVGQQITTAQIQQALNESFGDGAGDRIKVSCKGSRGDRVIEELTIGLQGQVDEKSDLAQLIAAAPSIGDHGCPGGLVKAVGR